MSDFKTFIVPYDFSAHSRAALYAAADLARRLSADIHLVNVLHTPHFTPAYGGATVTPYVDVGVLQETAQKTLETVAREIEVPGSVTTQVVESAEVSDAICRLAEEIGADLIVMGTHGRTGLAHVFLGSVAERTVRGAPCPVLTVQGREKPQ